MPAKPAGPEARYDLKKSNTSLTSERDKDTDCEKRKLCTCGS